jgi:predicted kinase
MGAPGSGKSTLAHHLQQQLANSCIVATDEVRASLYGDSAIQGSWAEIAAEVQRQCQQALTSGQTIIYDATNAQRPWRIEFLEAIAQYQPSQQWIGWYLNPSLSTCKNWNRNRERKVPPDVLCRLYQNLQENTPDPAEGMEVVETIDLSQIADVEREIRQRLKKR